MPTSIDIPDLLTTIYVLVDDWYQMTGQGLMNGKPGSKPEFSDSEMLTLMLAQDLIPYLSETQFVAFMPANYGFLFPRFIDANWEERDAADVLLQRVQDCDSFGDKGFLGQTWQAEAQIATHNRIWTVKRANQAEQNPPDFDQLLRHVRERI